MSKAAMDKQVWAHSCCLPGGRTAVHHSPTRALPPRPAAGAGCSLLTAGTHTNTQHILLTHPPAACLAAQIRDAFTNWANTVKKGDPKAVAALYTRDATLLPTVDNISPTDAAREAYFVE